VLKNFLILLAFIWQNELHPRDGFWRLWQLRDTTNSTRVYVSRLAHNEKKWRVVGWWVTIFGD
jgi:hypothetical protein